MAAARLRWAVALGAAAALAFARAAPTAGAAATAGATAGSDVFFYNSVSGASTYVRPDTLPVLDEATGRHYWVIGGEATWEPPDADHAWVPHREPGGHRYFENVLTGETTWTPPEAGAWEARSVSKKYYHNTVTNETTWDRPAVLGHESAEHNATFYDGTDGPTWDTPPAARWRPLVAMPSPFRVTRTSSIRLVTRFSRIAGTSTSSSR